MTTQLIETLRAAEWQIHELAHTVKRGSPAENQPEELVQTMAILITLLTGGAQIVVTRAGRRAEATPVTIHPDVERKYACSSLS